MKKIEQDEHQVVETIPQKRLFYIDHLRAFLAILVVIHHVALIYGASLPGYYYVEPPFTDPIAFQVLLVFVLVNQSWFMGAFFLISGYFTPSSFDRKGLSAFLKDKLLRLGVPILLFYFVLSPISFIGWNLMPVELTGIMTPLTWNSFWNVYLDRTSIGPLWFVAMLLIFSFSYSIWRIFSKKREFRRMTHSCKRSSSDWSMLDLLCWRSTSSSVSAASRCY